MTGDLQSPTIPLAELQSELDRQLTRYHQLENQALSILRVVISVLALIISAAILADRFDFLGSFEILELEDRVIELGNSVAQFLNVAEVQGQVIAFAVILFGIGLIVLGFYFIFLRAAYSALEVLAPAVLSENNTGIQTVEYAFEESNRMNSMSLLKFHYKRTISRNQFALHQARHSLNQCYRSLFVGVLIFAFASGTAVAIILFTSPILVIGVAILQLLIISLFILNWYDQNEWDQVFVWSLPIEAGSIVIIISFIPLLFFSRPLITGSLLVIGSIVAFYGIYSTKDAKVERILFRNSIIISVLLLVSLSLWFLALPEGVEILGIFSVLSLIGIVILIYSQMIVVSIYIFEGIINEIVSWLTKRASRLTSISEWFSV
jgi:hypothetical protein